MNRKIFEFLKNMRTRLNYNTPAMTTSPVNGVSCSGTIGYFNPAASEQTYQGQTATLQLPSDGWTYVANKIFVGNYTGNLWYISRNDYIDLYKNNVLVRTLNFDPVAYINGYYTFPDTVYDKAYHRYGSGSGWGSGQGYIGKSIYGYKYIG